MFQWPWIYQEAKSKPRARENFTHMVTFTRVSKDGGGVGLLKRIKNIVRLPRHG